MANSSERVYNIHEAKTHLSKLLDLMQSGEDVVIARAGTPIARLTPIVPPVHTRVLGTEAGRILIADDFDAPLPSDLLDDFGA